MLLYFVILCVALVPEKLTCLGASLEVKKGSNIAELSREDNNRIIGGKIVPINEYPFIVSIQMVEKILKALGYYHICGGTLIRPNWVLTAAHCALNMGHPNRVTIRKAKRFSIVAGLSEVGGISQEGKVYRRAADDSNRRQVNETHVNKYFHPKRLNDDLALMRVSEAFEIGTEIQLTRMPVHSTYKETKMGPCFAIGWGRTTRVPHRRSALQSLPARASPKYVHLPIPLKAIPVAIADFDSCKSAYGRWFGPRIYEDRSICTKAPDGGVFSGDSGGPMVCQNIQMGVTSFVSVPKSGPILPDVFTRIDFYLDWINATISTAPSLYQGQVKWCFKYFLINVFALLVGRPLL